MGAKAVIGTLVVVGVLAGGAWVADGVLRERTEDRLAAQAEQQIPGLDAPPDVTIEGFPFLLQVARGELDRVRVTADEATVEGLLLRDVVVHLGDVTTEQPYTARTAEMTALAPMAGIADAVGLDVPLTADGADLVATIEVLGLEVEVVLRPEAVGRDVRVSLVGLRAAGAEVDPGRIPGVDGLDGLTFPVDGLPAGMELTELTVQPDGVLLRAEGADVVVEAPPG